MGIEPGLMMNRSLHRIAGTLFALLLWLPIFYLLRLNHFAMSFAFIITLIGFIVSTMNKNRYDITVFFIILAVFFLLELTLIPALLDQIQIYRFLSTSLRKIEKAHLQGETSVQFLKKFRDNFIAIYEPTFVSADNLRAGIKNQRSH